MKSSYIILISAILLSACASTRTKDVTIADLAKKTLSLDNPPQTILHRETTTELYRRFLEKAPPGDLYGNALRRLADLELQHGQDQEFANNSRQFGSSKTNINSAIRLYKTFLETYPNRKNNDLVLYQLAKAYEISVQPEKLLTTLNTLATQYPESRYIEEVQFRRAETYFVNGNYQLAEQAYGVIIHNFISSPYYEKSLYKYGWTQFKQRSYSQASKTFLRLLKQKYMQGQLLQDGPNDSLSRAQKELLEDILRVISLSFSYQQGHESITNYFATNGHEPYESMIYNNLAELYLDKDRIRDAATTFLAYSKIYPTSSLAPKYHSRAIDAYKKGGFASLVLPAKISFVQQYGVNTAYWKEQDDKARKQITPLLKKHIRELASHYHALARKHKKSKMAVAEFNQAINWYLTYIKSFPLESETSDINFLLAEAYQDAGKYQDAIYQFEKTAYQYPAHKKQDDAAYAALLLYPELAHNLKGNTKSQWQAKKISSAIKYADHFPGSKHTPAILTNTAAELFTLKDYPRAASIAEKLSTTKQLDKKLFVSALLVLGHSKFEMRNYEQAELAYKELMTKIPHEHKEYNNIRERLAASIYKQGEQAKDAHKLELAAAYFLRVNKEVPSSKLSATADFDAATIYVELKSWGKAKNTLQTFRKRYPKNHKLQTGVTEKLALVYSKTGQPLKAANEMVYLAKNATHYDRDQRRELLWDAVKIYGDNKQEKKAKDILLSYLKDYPQPVEQAVEARQLLAEINKKTDSRRYYYWLREIIKADNKAGKQRSARTHFLAAQAYMELTLPLFNAYKSARLTIPLKKSLKRKKLLMQKVVKSYNNALKYRVAEITTSATYYIAEIYNDFATTLLHSQRPKKLSADELDQYNVLLEDQAYPFEEKAITIHEANAARVKDNIYDKWVQSSITALSKLSPVRYAKTEKGEAYVENIN